MIGTEAGVIMTGGEINITKAMIEGETEEGATIMMIVLEEVELKNDHIKKIITMIL